jgi:hypothetical protein
MFWALNGATFNPRRAKKRQSAVVRKLLPAQLEVPWIMIALIASPPLLR